MYFKQGKKIQSHFKRFISRKFPAIKHIPKTEAELQIILIFPLKNSPCFEITAKIL
jgi:hypothetical protein